MKYMYWKMKYIGEPTLTRGQYGDGVRYGYRARYVGPKEYDPEPDYPGRDIYRTWNGSAYVADPNGDSVMVWDSDWGFFAWSYDTSEWVPVANEDGDNTPHPYGWEYVDTYPDAEYDTDEDTKNSTLEQEVLSIFDKWVRIAPEEVVDFAVNYDIRIPPGYEETVLNQVSPMHLVEYALVVGERLPQRYENRIWGDPYAALQYVINMIEEPCPEAEQALAGHPKYLKPYREYFYGTA